MARPAKNSEASYSLVSPKRTKLPDHYDPSRGLVAVGDTMIVESNWANAYEESGDVDIIEEDVAPPWAPKEPEAPAVDPNAVKPEAKKPAGDAIPPAKKV